MAVRFRIDQAGSPGVPGQSRHDLDPSKAITLTALEPAGADYEWELIDRVGTNVALSAATGATVTLPATNATLCGFHIELRALVNGELVGVPERRVATVRSPGLGLRVPLFAESADPSSRLAAPNVDASTDNALYPSLAGTGTPGQNFRGFAQWAYEVTAALEAHFDKPPGLVARGVLSAGYIGAITPTRPISQCTAVVLVAGGSATVTGLPAPDDAYGDYSIDVMNGGAGAITFKHGAPTSGFPFDTGGSDVVFGPNQLGILYFDASNVNNRRWRLITVAAGGAVAGPASATDNAIPKYVGTGGKQVQNTGVFIDDDDNILLAPGKTIDGLDPSLAAVRLAALEAGAGVATAINVYVRTTGDDGNQGTADSPKKTIAAAWALLPKQQVAPFTLHLGSGTHAWTPPPANVPGGQRACITVLGDGAGGAGDDGHQVIRTATMAAGSTTEKLTTAETLTAFAHHGYTLEVTSGPNLGARRHIVRNGTGDITLSSPLPSVAAGQTVRITRPAVLIDMGAPSTTARMPFGRRALLNLVNLRVRGGNADFAGSDPLCLFGVELESQFFLPKLTMAGATGSYPFWRDGQAGAQMAYFKDWTTAAGLTLADGAWEGWGLAATTGTPHVSQYTGIDFYDSGYLGGYLTLPMINVAPGAADVTIRLYGGGVAAFQSQNPGLRIELFGSFYLGSPDWGGQEILRLLYDTYFWANGPLYIGQANYGYGFLTMSHNAKFLAFSPVTVQFTNPVATTQALFTLTGDAVFQPAQLTITTAVNTPYLFDISDTSKINCLTLTAPTALKEGIARRGSVVNVINYTGPSVVTRENAQLAGVPRSKVALHVYVAATGSDTNAGTAAAPKLTLTAAYALIPALLTVPFIIHLGAGTYAQSPPTPHTQLGVYGCVVIAGDAFNVVTTGTLGTGSSTTALVSTTTTMTVDQHVGATVEITSGTGIGCRRHIIANTASTLSLTFPIVDSAGNAINPASGVTYRIIRPSAILDVSQGISTSGNATLSQKGQAVHYVNIALGASGTVPSWTTHESERPCFHYGMEWQNGVAMYAEGISIFGAHPGSPMEYQREAQRFIYASLGGTRLTADWEGWGLAAAPGSISGFDGGARAFTLGYFTNIGLGQGGGEVSLWVFGGRVLYITTFRRGLITVGGTNPVLITPPTGTSALGVQVNNAGTNLEVQFTGIVNITQKGDVPAIFLGGGVKLTATHPINITANDLTAAALGAIRLEGNSEMYCYDAVAVTTTGSALLVRHNGKLQCQSPFVGTAGLGLQFYGNALAHFQSTLTSTVTNGPAFGVYDNAKLTTAAVVNCTAAAPGNGAVIIQGGEWTAGGTASRMVVNSANSAGSDAIRIMAGGVLKVLGATTPVFTASGTVSGYGVNCQGGGRFFCQVQPSGVYGVSADFIVGPNPGESFPDTELSVSYAARSAGASIVQRAS